MTAEKYPFLYYFYIITNKNRTVLYCGMTNNLSARLKEHENSQGNRKTFTGRYNCYYLIYYEGFGFVQDAIRREKEVKNWSRIKKESLIETLNPDWRFLNDNAVFDHTGSTKNDLSSDSMFSYIKEKLNRNNAGWLIKFFLNRPSVILC